MSDQENFEYVSTELALNYHLMHPGGDSGPGDPNLAYYLDGTYHLHYILRHPWHGDPKVHDHLKHRKLRGLNQTFSFIHVTSPDMLHWIWQPTKLQPSFTGHGTFSGTGFITKEGNPAAIYAGLSTPRHSYITVANNNCLSSWGTPFPVVAKDAPNAKEPDVLDFSSFPQQAGALLGDPDCFLIGDTYYAYSAANNLLLFKSTDLSSWTYVGNFLKRDLPDVAIGEDISCAHFFPLDGRWMLLCISHAFGCRYYLGDWDADGEQFVPEIHQRMNWRRPGEKSHRDFFAPESVLAADGRRVMWAWLASLDHPLHLKTIQSLPRELSLANDGSLRIRPLRELDSLRYGAVTLSDITIPAKEKVKSTAPIAKLDGDSWEIRITIDRDKAMRKHFGVLLFANGENKGFPVIIHPESGTIQLGTVEAPFTVSSLTEGEAFELRIFIDKYLVEVFVCARQAVLATHMNYQIGNNLVGYAFGTDITFQKIEVWKLKATNEGFFEAQRNPIWEPQIK